MTTDPMREAFEKTIFSLGYNIDRYSAIYPETVGQYMHMGVQTAYEVYQAALSQPRMTENVNAARELLEDGMLWVREMREGVNKWCDPFAQCGVHARMENLESWANHARALLAKLPAQKPCRECPDLAAGLSHGCVSPYPAQKVDVEELLRDMRCEVEYTDKVTMPIPLYERIKAAINAINGGNNA